MDCYFCVTRRLIDALFLKKFDAAGDPDLVIIDFKESRIVDHSGIEAVQKVTSKYLALNKEVVLKHLSTDCRKLLLNAGTMIEVNIMEDPNYKVIE